ncbi:MAG TPA: AAA family ATPase [Caulobacterales bacterium]|nr:AAA family ATPase [Caulobacterales bacterium]
MSAAQANASQPQPRARAAPIFAVASGKGGVGKTWLSTMLACAYGRAGQRALLVDCDLGLANVDVQLGVRPQADVHSVVRGFLELDAAVTPVLGGPGRNGGFDLIAGHSGSGALSAVKLEEVARIAQGVAKIAPHYDRVIMDCAAGIDPNVLRFARAADRLVLVTTEEPTALTDAYALVKLLRLQGANVVPWMIVNMAENRTKGRRVFDQFSLACNEYLGFKPKFAGVVCRDVRVPDSIRAQTPLPVRHPQSQAFEDVIRIVETLNAN